MANLAYYINAHKKGSKIAKPIEKPVDLRSVAERIRLFRCGERIRISEKELYTFEGMVAATDMYGIITKHPDWEEIEKKDGFNKIVGDIKEIRGLMGNHAGQPVLVQKPKRK